MSVFLLEVFDFKETFIPYLLPFTEQFMEFDEDNSGDIGKWSWLICDEKLLLTYWSY